MLIHLLKGFAIVCCSIFTISEVSGQSRLDRVSFDFMRLENNDEAVDTLSGKAYFFSDKLHLHVYQPVNQVLFIDGTDMKVFYPETNRGYHMKSQSAFDLPIVNSLIASLNDDYGLTKIGFQVQSNSISGDTLITQWEHETGSDAGVFTIYYLDDLIAKASFEAHDNSLLETELKNYEPFGNYSLPTQIITKRNSAKGTSIEHLYVKNIIITPNMPDSIKNFTYPDDASIEIREF
ncbi:MAG: hypothetical protein WD098_00095 [Balneolales bacterium]